MRGAPPLGSGRGWWRCWPIRVPPADELAGWAVEIEAPLADVEAALVAELALV